MTQAPPVLKHAVNEQSPVVPVVNPVPVHGVEQLTPDGHSAEAVKESLEPAATVNWGKWFFQSGIVVEHSNRPKLMCFFF